MKQFQKVILQTGELEEKRRKQHVIWMWNHIKEQIMRQFKANADVQKKIQRYEELVADGLVTPGMAADLLLKVFSRSAVI